jgi:hypothetical protein
VAAMNAEKVSHIVAWSLMPLMGLALLAAATDEAASVHVLQYWAAGWGFYFFCVFSWFAWRGPRLLGESPNGSSGSPS